MTVDTLGGGAFRLLTVVDELAGTVLMIHAGASIDTRNVMHEFELLARSHGMPAGACTFNTPPHIVDEVARWLRQNGSVHVTPSQTFASSSSGLLHRDLRRALLAAYVMDLQDIHEVIRAFIGRQSRRAPLEVSADAPITLPKRTQPAAAKQSVTPRAIARGAAISLPDGPSPSVAAAPPTPSVDVPTAQEPRRRRTMLARAATGAIVGVSALAVLVLGLGPLTGRYRTSPVLGNSMRPMFAKGDLVILLPKPSGAVDVGDVIQYMPTKGERALVTHRVLRITDSGDNPTVITKGDNNNYEDPYPVTLQDDFAWRVRWHVPLVGWGLHAFQTSTGLIVLGSAIGIFMLMNLASFVLEMRRSRRAVHAPVA